MVERDFEYDVGLSFAGEGREYVRQVADQLKVLWHPCFLRRLRTGETLGKGPLCLFERDISTYV